MAIRVSRQLIGLISVVVAIVIWPSVSFANMETEFSTSANLSFSESLFTQERDRHFSAKDKTATSDKVVTANNELVTSTLLDRTHKIVSQRFSRFFHQIDGFFGAGESSLQNNESWARVRFDTFKRVGEDADFKGAVKLRVVLPRAERRFRLLFSTEDDESTESGSQSTEENTSGNFSLALRFIRRARKNGTVNFDLGARYRDKRAQIFSRINLFYRRDLMWQFESSFTNSLYYFSVSGYENKFRYDLGRPLNSSKTLFLRGSTDLLWKKNQRGTIVGETIGLYAEIDDKKALAFEALASYTTSLTDEEPEYFRGGEVRLRFRHNLWRRWFYYEIWPSVSWAPANDYEPALGGMFRMEMVLGKF